jgi:hypothetical protein
LANRCTTAEVRQSFTESSRSNMELEVLMRQTSEELATDRRSESPATPDHGPCFTALFKIVLDANPVWYS